MAEEEEHDYSWAFKNKKKLEEAERKGNAVYFSYNCIGCEYYESIGPTQFDGTPEGIDDVEHGECLKGNPENCPRLKGGEDDG